MDRENIRLRLEQERERLAAELNQEGLLQAYGEGIRSEDAGCGTHMADDSSETYEKEQRLSLENNLRSILDQVESALHRMDTGAYGLCESCRQPIEEERLEALPYVRRCLFCTERLTKHRPA